METKRSYIIALDQGTTSSRCIIFSNLGEIISTVQKEFKQIFPQPGWVEHDPMEIYASQYSVMIEAIAKCGIKPHHIKALGITNQRETVVAWNKKTGKPIYNAIVWQCRRSASIIEQVKKDGLEEYIKENTGLVLDAYFSASKIKWIIDNVEGAKKLKEEGNLLVGNIDTWLMWKLSNGKIFATDYTNASRTMLFNIKTLSWDKKLCSYFGVSLDMLPSVYPSSYNFGTISIFGQDIPITGVAGDQQAALFGQACFNKGEVKTTYGTGCFLLMNTGKDIIHSSKGLITTIAASTSNNNISYALEGSVFVSGAVIQWIRDKMRFIVDATDSEYFATKIEDNGGVYLVPAFTGLGAPYWDMYARGTIFGITRGTTRNHIIRASLESIAYQVTDLIFAMKEDVKSDIKEMKVDGGASSNDFLMQFQADISNIKVIKNQVKESTALGAFYLAAIGIKLFSSTDEIKKLVLKEKEYKPALDCESREKYLSKWHKAVKMCQGWEE